jgi:hypothetical protein
MNSAIGRSSRLHVVAAATAILLCAAGPALAGIPARHATLGNSGGGTCQAVTQDALRSCRNGARASYFLALARCDNPSATGSDATSTQRAAGSKATDCDKAARQDQRDALSLCSDQFDARAAICDQLGGGVYAPPIDPANLTTTIDNPFDPMKPGTTFVYEGDTTNGREHNEVHVTIETRKIDCVECVAVRDTSTLDGVLVGIAGSFLAGVDGAEPGIIMEASPKVGDLYRQEFSISVAEDLGQVVGLNQSEKVPYTGPFSNALETFEFEALDPGSTEHKFYAPHVGFVLSVDDQTGERSELVSISP